ncbi:astacin-like metalloendopeptidase [Pantherophis guttatus]|uniref:Metalloendopeptidase n=1 Tax=Pantherophis guttatus TaxID=94885 RepID=A0ABM3YT36_PANGU|nr:astacin-like metalloendopeptidase [Pantherophis guttatus]
MWKTLCVYAIRKESNRSNTGWLNSLPTPTSLCSAQPVHGRGDTFQVTPTPDYDLEEEEKETPHDDILDINQGLIPLEAPEHSFLLEGDIIKVSPFRRFSAASPRWPKRKGIVQIPYIISYKYDRQSVKIIKEAFEDFAKFTCIQFVPYSYQRDFISIVPLSGCFSSAGRIGGMQVVSLAPDCLKNGKGVVLHELMHVLGFWHEHSRADRDKYIHISWNEILTGFEINFIKNWNTNMLDDYDYSSIMHYGRNAFSMTGLPTIVPLSSPPALLGQRWNLSISDIAKINKLYKCSEVAAQPEAVPEEAIKEKVMDFIPVQPEPCSAKSNLASPVVRKTTEPILSSQKTVGEDLSRVAGQLRRTEVAEQSVVVSAMTSHTREASRELQMPSKHVLETTQTRQMKTKATGNVVEKSPASWTSQNPSTGWQLRNQYLKAYTPTEQSPMETRVTASPEMERKTSSSQAKGSVLPSVEKIHGATTTLGQKEASVEVSGSKASILEPTGEGELSTAVELTGSLDMGSNETDVGMGSPRSPPSVVEKHSKGQSTRAFHQAVTASMNETGSPAYVHPVENVLTIVASSLSSSSILRNPTTISSRVELGEKSQGTEVEVLENIVTVSGLGRREVDAGSSHHEKSTALPYIQPPSVKNIREHGDVLLPRKETPVPEILEAQTQSMGWFTSGAPSSLQGVVTVHPDASELKENGSLDDSPTRIAESFSPLPPHLARNGYEWGESITGKPPGTVSSWHVTERRVEVDHAELPSQIPTWGKAAFLAIKTNVAVQPTEQSSKTASGPGDNRSWSQTSSDESHPWRSVTVGWSPSADVKRQTLGKTTETASMKTFERLPMTPKIDLDHRERLRRTTLVRQFPTGPSGSQVSTQHEQGDEETPSQPSSTLSRIAGAEHHEIQDSSSTNKLRAMVSPKPCGKKLAVSVSRTLTSPMGYTTEKFSSLNRQFKLGITGKRSPRPRIQESGPTSSRIFQLGGERNTSPRNWGGFTKPGGRNGTSNSTEHLEEETLSVKTNEFTQTTTTKRAPEITVVSDTRPVAPLTVGSSHFFTILAHDKPTLNRSQSRFHLGGTDSVTRPESLPTRSLELATETELPFQLNQTVPSAEGRSLVPASSTAGLTMGGMSLATARVQEGTSGRHSTGLPSLERQPTSLEETAPPSVTGSLLSPEPVNLKEGSVGGHLGTATSSVPRNTSLVGTTVALSTDLSSTIILENQTIMQYDSKQITGIPSKPSEEMPVETNGSTLASTETHRTSHAGFSTRGSHEEHTKLLQFESGPQTKAKPSEEITGPILDGKTSTLFLEETWKIFTKENDAYRSEEPAAAKLTRISSKASEESHIGTTGATGLGVKSSSHLIPTNPSKETEKSTIFNEKNVHRTSGPFSESYSVALMPPHSNVPTSKVIPSVSDVYHPRDIEKVEAADVYHKVTKLSKEALVPSGISLPQIQTLGSAETGRRSSTTYGIKGLEKATETPTRVKDGELFPLATELSRQISETQVATTLEQMTRSQKNERSLEENESFLASNPIRLHHVNKRSLLGIMATPPPFILSSPAPDSKLGHSNIGQVNPRRLRVKKLFPKKHMCKIMASSGGTVQRLLLPGYLRGYLSHPGIGQDVALSIENMTKVTQPENLILRSTLKSKLWSLLRKLSPSEKKRGNKPELNQRTTGDILISCSFKENLCGWKQRQNDSLDWTLEKEEEKSSESMEVSGKHFRSLDGYISLKPSGHLPKQRAVLISPVVYGIRCLQFWYRSTDCAAGKINFYTKCLNSTKWHKVTSVKGKQDIGWHQVAVYISTTWALQVALEGIVGNEVRCKVQIDDLSLCQKPCGQCLQ